MSVFLVPTSEEIANAAKAFVDRERPELKLAVVVLLDRLGGVHMYHYGDATWLEIGGTLEWAKARALDSAGK